MNEEIKKILDRFKNNYDELGLSYYPEDILGPKELKLLYNYITNLQKENEHKDKLIDIANAGISNLKKENRRLSKTTVDYDELLLEKINELLKIEEENEKLNKIIDEINECMKKYEKTSVDEAEIIISFYKQLKNILNKLTELKKEVK